MKQLLKNSKKNTTLFAFLKKNIFLFIFFACVSALFAEESPIEYSIIESDTLRAVFELPCSVDRLWNLITDYPNSDKVMPNIKKSIVLSSERIGSDEISYVETVVGYALFSMKYTVKMTADKQKGILSWDQTKGSFSKNSGSWHLTAVSDKCTKVVYTTSLSHKLMPDRIKNSLVKKSLPDLYESLKEHTHD